MNNREVMQQALEALIESVDLVRNDYQEDWRHGMPTRKAQLGGKREALESHEAAITALRAALEEPNVPETDFGNMARCSTAAAARMSSRTPTPRRASS